MASSEISSSEINQSQGEYHDGKNEMAGLPPLTQPVSPSDIAVHAEEGIWKKYSSHYEFPLSIVIAVGIHVIALLCVVAYMTISFYFGAPKPIPQEMVTYDPPRMHQEGDAQQERPGGSNGNQGDNARDPFRAEVDPAKVETPDQTQSITKDLLDGTLTTPVPPSLPPQPKRPGAPGKDDGGIGNESGLGIGNKPGVGVAMGRNKRWRIHFNYDEPEVLLSQFVNLNLVAGVRLNKGHYYVNDKLAQNGVTSFRDLTTDEFIRWVNEVKRLWFINTDTVTCENFALAVRMSERALTLVVVLPTELENAILAAELKYHQMTEPQIREKRLVSTFDVVREGSAYKVTVAKTEVLK